MSRFLRSFTHRALLLARNDGSIRAPIITENDGFFISRRYAIPEYPTGVFGAITVARGDDFSGLSIHGNPDPHFVLTTNVLSSQLVEGIEQAWRDREAGLGVGALYRFQGGLVRIEDDTA